MKVKRGDIIIANLESVSVGSIQKYRRPYLVISNNVANKNSPVITAVALSSKTSKKRYQPTHCYIRKEDITKYKEGFGCRNSIALCEQIVSIDITQIEEVVAKISDKNIMKKINQCLRIQVGMDNKYN